MSTWFWLNIPVGLLLFSAMVGIPLWLVIKHPYSGQEARETAARATVVPLPVLSRDEARRWREAA